jgi:hypothetical protein
VDPVHSMRTIHANETSLSIADFRIFLDFKICRVLNVVFFPLGDSPASEFCADVSERSVCSIFIGGVNKKNNWDETHTYVHTYTNTYIRISQIDR